MAFRKREYTDEETLITAKNLNDMQDAIIELEGGLFAIEAGKSGEAITITDASNRGFRSLNVYGKTTQGGTPSLEAPVEIVNVGNNGGITVDVNGGSKTQRMTISTPHGLPGIPVTSGGNYTDANGQQWVCDEVDFERGVYVRRVAYETVTLTFTEEDSSGRFRNTAAFKNHYKSGNTPCLCNIAEWKAFGNVNNSCCVAAYSFYYRNDDYTLAEINALVGNIPITVVGVLDTPQETPLSEEELAAYAALHTYRDNTTVSNDAGAYMELEYVMDAKKYIDSLLKAGGWISDVSLPASAWKGTKSPYSQVVQIPGVTENSQVDLTPDVAQLSIFHEKDLAFVTENVGGVVTVYAIGQKPTSNYTIQATIKEVYA